MPLTTENSVLSASQSKTGPEEEHIPQPEPGQVLRVSRHHPASRTLEFIETIQLRPGEEYFIGRRAHEGGSSIVLLARSVSGRHARLKCDALGVQCTLFDNGSSNGTRLGVQRIKPHIPYRLRPGECFQVGPFELQYLINSKATVTECARNPHLPIIGRDLRQPFELHYGNGSVKVLITDHPVLVELYKQIAKAAQSDCSVLILGETGTGKEIVAKVLHAWSARHQGSLVSQEVSGLSGELLCSELFGHKKGAYTGAATDRIGCFRSANKGTLFLDEIGEIDANSQIKLLRVLENKTIKPLGMDTDIAIDTRIISATQPSLLERIRQGAFREDLYHRLCGYVINMPTLREFCQAIPLFVSYFLDQKSDSRTISFSPSAFEQMMKYSWPGNIRELKNFVDWCEIEVSCGEVDQDAFARWLAWIPSVTLECSSDTVRARIGEAKTQKILEEYGRCPTDRKQLAANLGYKPRQTQRLLRELGLTRPYRSKE